MRTHRLRSPAPSPQRQQHQGGEALNAAFEQLGAPTYSRILWGVDADGRSEFHLLVISTHPIFPREAALLDKAWAWLREGIQNE